MFALMSLTPAGRRRTSKDTKTRPRFNPLHDSALFPGAVKCRVGWPIRGQEPDSEAKRGLILHGLPVGGDSEQRRRTSLNLPWPGYHRDVPVEWPLTPEEDQWTVGWGSSHIRLLPWEGLHLTVSTVTFEEGLTSFSFSFVVKGC